MGSDSVGTVKNARAASRNPLRHGHFGRFDGLSVGQSNQQIVYNSAIKLYITLVYYMVQSKTVNWNNLHAMTGVTRRRKESV